jgi:hypothetical protein
MNKKENKNGLPGYLPYPQADDIYRRSKEEPDIDPEDTLKNKSPNDEGRDGEDNERSFREDVSGRDLDVPGSELDDLQEDNGNEDEENNSYSLGGDEHNDLEEDKGD